MGVLSVGVGVGVGVLGSLGIYPAVLSNGDVLLCTGVAKFNTRTE